MHQNKPIRFLLFLGIFFYLCINIHIYSLICVILCILLNILFFDKF